MELLCPHCQKQLSIADEHAGKLLKCPACTGMFTAPSLPSPPPPSSPPPSHWSAGGNGAAGASPPMPGPATFKLSDPPTQAANDAPPPPPPPLVVSEPIPQVTLQPQAPVPPPPPGSYGRVCVVTFNRDILSLFAPVGLLLIFVLSFFPWIVNYDASDTDKTVQKNLWQLSGDGATFIVYLIFVLLALIMAVVAVLLDKKVFSLPEPIKVLRRWRSVIVAGLAGIAFLALLIHAVQASFGSAPDLTKFKKFLPTLAFRVDTIWIKIVYCVHTLVVVGALLDFWLQHRKRKNLPIPKIEMHW